MGEQSKVNPSFWGRPELWLSVAALLAAFVASLSVSPSLWGVGVALVNGLAAGAVLFGLWNAVRRLRSKPVRGVPGVDALVPERRQWPILLAMGLAFFSIREGALAPDIEFDLHHFTVDWDLQTNSNWNVNGFQMDDMPAVRLAERELRISLPQCHGDADICRAFQDAMPTTEGQTGDPSNDIATLTLQVSTQMSGTCMMPLSKSAAIRLDANGTVFARGDDEVRILDAGTPVEDALPDGPPRIATKTLTFNSMLDLDQEMVGPASCRAFKEAAGAHLAKSLLATIRSAIDRN